LYFDQDGSNPGFSEVMLVGLKPAQLLAASDFNIVV